MRRPGAGRPVRLPPHAPGMRIGLYGGSFDPPHAGHRHVALTALRRLGLDRVWWIVTPGNPLKPHRPSSSQAARLAAAAALARHPRMAVTDVEARIGSVLTVDTLGYLRRRCPGVRLVWIMGADGLADFARWRAWRTIAALAQIAVVDRPGWTLKAARYRAGVALARARTPEWRVSRLSCLAPPAWALLYGPRSELSSTRLRGKDVAPRGQGCP